MVAARRVPGHGHTRRVRPFWQWARPSDIEWLRLLRQLDLSIAVGEAVAEVRCRVPGFPPLLELRLAGLLGPRPVGSVPQVPQRGRQWILGWLGIAPHSGS